VPAVAAWFGLVAGLLESVSHVVRYFLDDTPLRLGLYLVWMPALANLLFFTLVGLLLAPLAHRWPRLLTPTRMLGLFATLAAMAALRLLDGFLGVLTVDIIALGIGVRVAAGLGPVADRFLRFLRPALPMTLGAVLVCALAIEARYAVGERRALGRLPAASAHAPNVLFLVLDTVRAFNLSAYGYGVPTTPVLGALAGRGVRFGRAYSTAPWTLPSHASMFTGRWAHETTADWYTPLDASDTTLAEALAARGYRTGAVVANIRYASGWTGLNRGFAHFGAQEISLPQVLRSAAFTMWLHDATPFRRFLPPAWREFPRKGAGEVNDALLTWLDRTPGPPFFAFLNYLDAHAPYLPRAPFDTAFSNIEYPPLPGPAHGGHTEDDRPRAMRPYDQAIAYIDAEIGRLLHALDQRGLLENTVVVITSDHGEEFGEHGVYGHGHALYLPALTVPLIVVYPGQVPSGLVVEGRASLRDLASTVMDLTGLPGRNPFPGRSLARFWQGELPAPDTILASTRWARNRPSWDATSRGDLQGLLTADRAFIRDVDLTGELYQIALDSGQTRNVATDPGRATDVAALQEVLDRRMGTPVRAPADP